MSDSYAAVWRTKWESPYHFTVAMIIARFSARNGVCTLRQKAIARLAACSVRKVADVLQDMQSHDPPQIELIGQFRDDGSRAPSRVRLTLSANLETQNPNPMVTEDDFSENELQDVPVNMRVVQGGPAPDALNPSAPRAEHREARRVSKNSESEDSADAQDSDIPKRVLAAWDVLSSTYGFPGARLLEHRKGTIMARISEHGPDAWKRVFDIIESSAFLQGKVKPRDGKDRFALTFDWLSGPRNFTKVIEGNYSGGATPARPGAESDLQTQIRADKALQRAMLERWTQDRGDWPDDAGPPPGAAGCILDADITRGIGSPPAPTPASGLAEDEAFLA